MFWSNDWRLQDREDERILSVLFVAIFAVFLSRKNKIFAMLPVLFSLPYLFADFYTEQEHVDGLIVFLI